MKKYYYKAETTYTRTVNLPNKEQITGEAYEYLFLFIKGVFIDDEFRKAKNENIK